MSLFVFFISLLIVAQHVSGNHMPIIRSCVHGWVRETNPSMDAAPDDGHMVARNMLSNY